MTPEYPSKLYYSISEVARITDVKAHVLRYWETEFSTLKPRKTRTGNRRYRQVDIDEIKSIKSLLYDEGFKIAGALKMRRLAKKKVKETEFQDQPQMDLGFGGVAEGKQIQIVKEELKEILVLVRRLGEKDAGEALETGKKEMKAEG